MRVEQKIAITVPLDDFSNIEVERESGIANKSASGKNIFSLLCPYYYFSHYNERTSVRLNFIFNFSTTADFKKCKITINEKMFVKAN